MGCSDSTLCGETHVSTEVSVTDRGTSLSFIQSFAEEAYQTIGCNVTIADVVEKVVRPRCASHKCCLHNLLPPQHRGKPSVFISHTWSRPLKDLVESLSAYFLDSSGPTFVWLDLIAINQVPYLIAKGLLNEDVSNLAKVIKSVEHTLFLLDPRGVVLTRIWCLFEVWQTLVHKSPSALIILHFEADLLELRSIFKKMSVAQAQATLDDDRLRILKEIEGSIGFSALDVAIRDALVESARLNLVHIEAQQKKQLEEGDISESEGSSSALSPLHTALSKAMLKYGGMLVVSGNPRDGLPLLQRGHQMRKDMLGPDHLLTYTAASHLATCFLELGQNGEALELAYPVFVARQKQLGNDHPDTISAATTLASCHQALGKLCDAESMFRYVLENSSGTFMALANLAGCLNRQGRHTEARKLLEEALESLNALQEERELDKMYLLGNVASCYQLQGQFSAALDLHLKTLDVHIRMLGPAHPTTAFSMLSAAGCLRVMGEQERALELYNKTFVLRKEALGAAHPLTLVALNGKATCLVALGQAEEAERVYKEVLASQEAVLGLKHPDTLQTVNDLATCISKLGRPQEAEILFRRSSAGRAEILGQTHPDTLVSFSNLAVMLRMQKKHHEAAPLLRAVVADSEQHVRLLTAPSPPKPNEVDRTITNHARMVQSLARSLQQIGSQQDSYPIQEAFKLLRNVVELFSSWYGPNHEQSILARQELGDALAGAGYFQEAEPIMRSVLHERLEAQGEKHEDTQDAIATLTSIFNATGIPVTRETLGLPHVAL